MMLSSILRKVLHDLNFPGIDYKTKATLKVSIAHCTSQNFTMPWLDTMNVKFEQCIFLICKIVSTYAAENLTKTGLKRMCQIF